MSVEIEEQKLTREGFIQEWADIAVAWGMSKSMAAIHVYLLTSKEPVSADELQDKLDISRGCISTNLSTLTEFDFVEKVTGADRKDFYQAHKNTFEILQKIIAFRRARELTPFIQLLEKYCPTKMKDELTKESLELICDFRLYAGKADKFLTGIEKKTESVFVRSFLNMIK